MYKDLQRRTKKTVLGVSCIVKSISAMSSHPRWSRANGRLIRRSSNTPPPPSTRSQNRDRSRSRSRERPGRNSRTDSNHNREASRSRVRRRRRLRRNRRNDVSRSAFTMDIDDNQPIATNSNSNSDSNSNPDGRNSRNGRNSRHLQRETEENQIPGTIARPSVSVSPPPRNQSNSNGNNVDNAVNEPRSVRRSARVRRQRRPGASGAVALGFRRSARIAANLASRNRNSAQNNNVTDLTSDSPDAPNTVNSRNRNRNGSARRRGRPRTARSRSNRESAVNGENGEDSNSSRPQLVRSRSNIGPRGPSRRSLNRARGRAGGDPPVPPLNLSNSIIPRGRQPADDVVDLPSDPPLLMRAARAMGRAYGRRNRPLVSDAFLNNILDTISMQSQRIFSFGSADHDESTSFDEFSLRDYQDDDIHNLDYTESDDEDFVILPPERPQGNRNQNRRQRDGGDHGSDDDTEDDDVIVTGDNRSDRSRVHRHVDPLDLANFLRVFHQRMGEEFGADGDFGEEMMCDHERQRHISMLPTRTLKAMDLQGKTCRICLQPFKEGETVKTLLCFHQFHSQCADPWFQTKLNCPTCRHTIVATSDDP